MSVLLEALYYAERGWPVTPIHWKTEEGTCSCGKIDCKGAGKHPILEHAYQEASKDTRQILQWWKDYPDANVAIAAGFKSGIVVLDIDPRHGGHLSLEGLLKRYGELPHTIQAKTGGGGRHYLFQTPKRELRGRIGMLPGIDVRAEGQLFVAPPSRHASGGTYEWDEKFHPRNNVPAKLPFWLQDKIRTKSNYKPEKKGLMDPESRVPGKKNRIGLVKWEF